MQNHENFRLRRHLEIFPRHSITEVHDHISPRAYIPVLTFFENFANFTGIYPRRKQAESYHFASCSRLGASIMELYHENTVSDSL